MQNPYFRNQREKLFIYSIIITVLALVFLYLYLPFNCTVFNPKDGKSVTSTQLTSKQQSQLREFILDDIHNKYPRHQVGFGIIATKHNYACVEVFVGSDLSFNRTPTTSQEIGDFGENWAVLYLAGKWYKIGVKRVTE